MTDSPLLRRREALNTTHRLGHLLVGPIISGSAIDFASRIRLHLLLVANSKVSWNHGVDSLSVIVAMLVTKASIFSGGSTPQLLLLRVAYNLRYRAEDVKLSRLPPVREPSLTEVTF